jgi:DNA polymerase III subunit gamma/tau
MPYLAIARKWRPTSFDEIAGQRHVTRTLRNAIQMGRIHHAFLFTGPRGVGKTTAARALARALNCVKGPTPDPCGECAMCTSILAGTASDVVEIDGASNNSVDDIRELREGVRYLPSMGRYRIYIIDEVHMLTRGAFNALLKTLEEPPPHVIFVFATTEVQKIPETILSRVQRFDFKRIPASIVASKLKEICDSEGIEVSEHALRLVATAGEGSMRDSQSLLDQVISFSGKNIADDQVIELLGLVDRSLLYGMLAGLVGGNANACLDIIARIDDFGYEIPQFTSELLEVLRNAALVALSPDAAKYVDVSADELEKLGELARGMGGAAVFTRWFDAMLDIHEQVSRAARPRLVLEMGVARLASIRPTVGIDQLLARVEDLDRRLRSAGTRSSPGRPGPTSGTPAGPSGSNAPGGGVGGRAEPPFGGSGPTRTAPAAPAPRAPVVASPSTSGLERPEQTRPPSPGARRLDLPVQATPTERYGAVLDALLSEDEAWTVFADSTALGSVRDGVVTLLFPSDVRLVQCRERAKAPSLEARLTEAFPGFLRVELALRDPSDDSRPTRLELRQGVNAERLERARAAVQAHPVVRRLEDRLGAVVESIIPL